MVTTELSELPPATRCRRYRELAADARREAANSIPAARNSYLIIAEQWERLAADIEAALAKSAANSSS